MAQKKFSSSCMAVFQENKPTYDEKKMLYLCFQREIAPSTGKLHWQVFVQFKDKGYGTKYCQKYLNCPNCHLDARRGTPQQASDYCHYNVSYEKKLKGIEGYEDAKDKKGFYVEGSFEEFGNIENCPKMKQGKRNDLIKEIEKINNGSKLEDLDPVAVIKYSKGLKELIALKEKKDATKKGFSPVEVYVIYGDSEAGKSKKVYEREGYENVYKLRKPTSRGAEIYFDKYSGEKVLLLDDFYGWLPWCFLLELLDGYTLQLNQKHGITYKNWDKVYITSNKPYEMWYNKEGDELDPLKRRINFIVHMTNKKGKVREPVRIDENEF